MNRRLILLITAVAMLGGFAILAEIYTRKQAAKLDVVALEQAGTVARQDAMRLGDPSARVVIVEFFDPACETCALFAPVVKDLLEQHPGRVQLVLRYAPLHHGSERVVAILEAARRQDRYWETLEILFATQAQWASHHDPQPEAVWALLEAGGIDVARLRDDVNDPAIAAVVARDLADMARLGVSKTPSFFVNDRPLARFGRAELEDLVEAALDAAY